MEQMQALAEQTPIEMDWSRKLQAAGIMPIDVYETRMGWVQFERYGDIHDTLNKLLRAGYFGTGQRDWLNDEPYSIVRIIEEAYDHVTCLIAAGWIEDN